MKKLSVLLLAIGALAAAMLALRASAWADSKDWTMGGHDLSNSADCN